MTTLQRARRILACWLLIIPLAAAAAIQIAITHASTAVAAVTATDWPTYLHDWQRTASQSDTTFGAANAAQMTKLWAFKTGGPISASASVVNNVIYVGSWDGYEYAINATNGAMLWETFLGITSVTNTQCIPMRLGISSTAALAGGVVYVGGGDAYWYALDASSGAVLWKVYTGDNSTAGGHFNWSSPLLYNGFAYIGIASLSDCPLVQGQILQVSLSTHQVVNTLNLVPDGQVGAGVWTSPSVDPSTNTIFVTTGTLSDPTQHLAQAVVAVDAGTLAVTGSWQIPAAATVNDSDWGTSPLIYDDQSGHHLVLATNKNGLLYSFNRASLSSGPVWARQVAVGGNNALSGQGSVSSAAVGGGLFYQAGGNSTIASSGYPGAIRAFNPVTGALAWAHGDPAPLIAAVAYSNGLVFDGAGNTFEALDATTGTRLYSYATGGTIFGAPSVSNGRIFVGSVDGNLYGFGLPATTPPPPPPDPHCPAGWTCQDLGAPMPAGSEKVNGTKWTVNAVGTGLTGTTDQGRLIAKPIAGDARVTAQLTSEQATQTAAQGGVIVRQSADPTSPYYAALITPEGTLALQYRTAWAGATTVAVALAAPALPRYLQIQRIADRLQAATSADGKTYTLVPGTTATVVMPATTLDGVFAGSGVNGTTWQSAFAAVSLGAPGAAPLPAPSAHPCPSGWACQDVGNPATVGDQIVSGGTWTVAGSGTGITGYSDQFHFVWQSFAADATVSARIVSQTGTDVTAMSGLQLRQDTGSGAVYYGAFVTSGGNLVIQDRQTEGLATAVVTSDTQTAPAFVRITRFGNAFSTYTSPDGSSWSYVLGSGVTVGLTGTVLGGMAVTGYDGGALNTATEDTVTTANSAPAAPQICPSGWECQDIGNPYPAGSQSINNRTWTVLAGGGDIWGTADQFRLVAQQVSGDASISARVVSMTNTSAWAKAGVMLRQSTDPGAAFYAAYVTPGNGIVVQYRTSQGSSAAEASALSGVTPAYMEVVRWGNTYGAYTSPDGVSWSLVPNSLTALGTSGAVLGGMALTSHLTDTLNTAVFDTVSVSTTTPPNPTACPSGWSCADIGGATPAGNQLLDSGTWQVSGGGADIWGTADQFRYISEPLAGDGGITAHIISQTNTQGWAKAGVMIRQTSDAGSEYYAILVTPANGVVVQDRTTQAGNTATVAQLAPDSAPLYLAVWRSGNVYSAYTSPDGSTWTLVPGSTATVGAGGAGLIGMAVTSHDSSAVSTVVIDTVTNPGSPP